MQIPGPASRINAYILLLLKYKRERIFIPEDREADKDGKNQENDQEYEEHMDPRFQIFFSGKISETDVRSCEYKCKHGMHGDMPQKV